MLDTIERTQSVCAGMPYEPLGGGGPIATQALIPMLDWPTDLFNKFTVEDDDESADQHLW